MSEHQGHDHQHHHQVEKVHVSITYTGKHDFNETVDARTTFGQVKLRAMTAFKLDPHAASAYVLQLHDADVDDSKELGSLQQQHVTLRLMLKTEPTKG